VHLIDPPPDERTARLINTALAGRTAEPIVSAFFAVFHERWTGAITAEDKKVMKCLRNEIMEVVTERSQRRARPHASRPDEGQEWPTSKVAAVNCLERVFCSAWLAGDSTVVLIEAMKRGVQKNSGAPRRRRINVRKRTQTKMPRR